MLTLLLILLTTQPPRVGTIHILVESGDTIFLDGKEMGLSSYDAGGMVINEVPIGDHEITVRTPAGATAATHVVVEFGGTATVSISSLGLRARARGTESTIEMQVIAGGLPCQMRVGLSEVSSPPAELRIEHIHPGPQNVLVSCGDKRADGEFEIPPGKIVTMAADLTARKMRIIDARERVTAVNVPTVADAIMHLELPLSWKRAIVAVLPPGVRPRSIVQNGMRAEAAFLMPNYEAAYTFAAQLKERSEVASVYVSEYGYSKEGYVFRFIIAFRTL